MAKRNAASTATTTPTTSTVPHRVHRTPSAAAFVGLTKRGLDDMAYHRRGPRFRKVGRVRVYLEADLLAWLLAQPQGGEAVSA